MSLEDVVMKVGMSLSTPDPVGDAEKEALNQVGRLAPEELWRRHGGPPPWDKVDGPDGNSESEVISRTVTSAEAGIVDVPLTEEQEAKRAGDEEAIRKHNWEESEPQDELEDALKARIKNFLTKTKPA